MEKGKHALIKLCRACFVFNPNDTRSVEQYQEEIHKCLWIDVTKEHPDIQPQVVCGACARTEGATVPMGEVYLTSRDIIITVQHALTGHRRGGENQIHPVAPTNQKGWRMQVFSLCYIIQPDPQLVDVFHQTHHRRITLFRNTGETPESFLFLVNHLQVHGLLK